VLAASAGGVQVWQPRLLDSPIVALSQLTIDDANRLLIAWGHRLGAVHRPFSMEAYALEVDGVPVSVAISASSVSSRVTGTIDGEPIRLDRHEIVELARLGSDPESRWATRVMLRLWRETCALRWTDWPVTAAISYSHNAMHPGNLYRFDGWTRISDNCGSTGGGIYSRRRYATDAVHGRKSLWLWNYARR
jgi:hypothetical protein